MDPKPAPLRSLPLFHRIAGKRVVVIGDGIMGEAKTRLVERAGGIPCGEPEAHHAALAFIALEDERSAESAAIRLRAKGLLVNVADRPDLCDFTTPSLLDRDPVLIAIGTSGASAGLAKQLRLRLEKLLPASLGRLAQMLSDRRDDIRARFPPADGRRRALDDALGEGGVLDPLDDGAANAFEGWLAGTAPIMEAGQVVLTLASDDPEDLTLRQARLLGTADTILFEPLVPPAILDRARADALRRPLPHDGPLPDGLTLIIRLVE
ncbi:Uroporphyrinogen-III C-methyltransferase [Alteripontixanthobacter maritimus]|uniref:precorrin-2 dehydrogenase n=1 Tax=Alteripontixanthobacter maritimus TaxID=2161824 RepID=A0A369QBI4_9SPHN|nr:bifunctional precorrin-2 dehydrogenase/sirohydrochlorin ferrochelatase [Alteripontixanthobacter maritimus]RDC60586.1 Uroporphyrinogen-III C-methyltransferase [Alteripontixanthobacter maritimus]